MSEISTAETEASKAWGNRVGGHGDDLITAAAASADREVSAARGLDPRDYSGHGTEGRAAWYVAAAKYVDEHCGACSALGPVDGAS